MHTYRSGHILQISHDPPEMVTANSVSKKKEEDGN